MKLWNNIYLSVHYEDMRIIYHICVKSITGHLTLFKMLNLLQNFSFSLFCWKVFPLKCKIKLLSQLPNFEACSSRAGGWLFSRPLNLLRFLRGDAASLVRYCSVKYSLQASPPNFRTETRWYSGLEISWRVVLSKRDRARPVLRLICLTLLLMIILYHRPRLTLHAGPSRGSH